VPALPLATMPSGPFQLRQALGWLAGRFNSVVWSPDGQHIAAGSDDRCVRIWNTSTGEPEHLLEGHWNTVQSVAWSPDGQLLASGSADGTVRVWEVHSGRMLLTLKEHWSWVQSAAWSPDSRLLASGSDDKSVRVWEVHSGRMLHTLEGHQNTVQSVAWSPDGRLLASGSADNAVWMWSTDTWTEIKRYTQASSKYFLLDVSFCALTTVAPIFGDEDIVLRTWETTRNSLFDAVSAPASIYSTSAKIVFVGESNVGKSCLALRLAENRYEEQGSTLGMKLWTLQPEQLDPDATAPPGEKRDITLWDLGGQDEYRLVHQLFLHDTTLALVLFDPTRGRTAFEEVEGWNVRLEKQLHGRKTVKLLVGTKKDLASTPVDQAGLQHLINTCGFAEYFFTSAKTGDGTAELRAAIAQALDWESLSKTTRPVLFQHVRDEIDTRRSKGEVVLLYEDLEKHLQKENPEYYEPEAVQTVVQQLTLQGVITDTRLTSGQRVLVLQISEIERYAGSLILTVRNNPRGVPTLEEREITAGRITFPSIKQEDRLHPFQERIVLESVVQLLLEHGICFKHEGLLIFPALFPATLSREATKTGESISLYYDFSGPVDNIYSALVVTLALSEGFGRVRLWADGAEFEQPRQGICGVRKVGNRQGIAHLDLYFSAATQDSVRNLFIVFIEDHLRKEGVTITEGLQLSCTACGYRFEQSLLGEHLAAGLREISCPRPLCKTTNRITQKAADVRASDPEIGKEFIALKTVIERRSQQDVAEIKSAFAKADTTDIRMESIRILHLSDLHITAYEDPITRLQPLLADLRDKEGGFGCERLDYLVLSGDLTNRATPEEFDKVYQLISRLIECFELSAERCLIVPGNHDLSWDEHVYEWQPKRRFAEATQKPGSFTQQGDGYLLRNDAKYPQRFVNFGKFYHSLIQQPYPLKAEEQGLSFLFPDTSLQFLALNSAWEIDEFFQHRSSINDSALANGLLKADEQIKQAKDANTLTKDASILRIAVWHHPATGNEKIVQDAFLERLRQATVQLCLHGHVHEERTDLVGYVHPRKIHIAGAGSFGAVAKDRPESTPRLYNLLEIARDHSWVKVHTRHMRKDGGAWEGWAVWLGAGPHEKRTYYEIKLTETKS
jgi:small GTP-binding protein